MTREQVIERLSGAFPVVPTPFADDQSLDLDGLGEVIDRILDKRVKGLTILGSGAESVYLSEGERCSVLEYAAKRVGGRATLLAGVMRFGTANAVEQTKRFRDLGADAVMVALPQYYPTPLSKIIVHYRSIADEGGVPTLYYHYPKPTHLELTPSDVAKVFAEVDLVGMKNSSVDTNNVLTMIEEIERPIKMFTGQSFDCLPCMNGGAVGAICPVALLMPKTAVELVDKHRAGDAEGAQAAQNRFYQAVPIVMPEQTDEGLYGVPHAGVKAALVATGILRSARVRDPQPELSEKRRREIAELAPKLVEL